MEFLGTGRESGGGLRNWGGNVLKTARKKGALKELT